MNRLSKFALVLALSGLTAVAGAQQGTTSSDETVTANVKSMLAQRPDLKVDRVKISTKDGIVYLTGAVDTTAEQRDLESIAKKTSGVKKVVNQTTVNSGVN